MEGFPGLALRQIIERDNLFLSLKRMGRKIRFADAYLVDSVEELAARRFKSVTTVMALTVPESISTAADLMADRALMGYRAPRPGTGEKRDDDFRYHFDMIPFSELPPHEVGKDELSISCIPLFMALEGIMLERTKVLA